MLVLLFVCIFEGGMWVVGCVIVVECCVGGVLFVIVDSDGIVF